MNRIDRTLVDPRARAPRGPSSPFSRPGTSPRTSCPPPWADSTRPPLTTTEAGAVGSALLLGSATAGFTLAAHVARLGPRRLARAGLLLAAAGYGTAALTTALPAVVAGAVLGGLGSGTATAVAATGIAAQSDPHRVSTQGLLSVSALAGTLYLTIPGWAPATGSRSPPSPSRPCSPARRRPVSRPRWQRRPSPGRLPHLRHGITLAVSSSWSLAQNSLWGVSGRIGTTRPGSPRSPSARSSRRRSARGCSG